MDNSSRRAVLDETYNNNDISFIEEIANGRAWMFVAGDGKTKMADVGSEV